MNLSVNSPRGARRVIWGFVVCVAIVVLAAAVLFLGYQHDRNEDQAQQVQDRAQRAEDREQIGALEGAVNTLAEQLNQEGVEPVVESAAEVSPDAPPPALPGRDGRDGTTPPCMSTPTRCQGATGISGAAGGNGADGADGTNGVDGVNGANGLDGTNGVDGTNGQDSTVPGPEGPPCPTGTTGQFVPAPLPSTDTWWVCVQNPL